MGITWYPCSAPGCSTCFPDTWDGTGFCEACGANYCPDHAHLVRYYAETDACCRCDQHGEGREPSDTELLTMLVNKRGLERDDVVREWKQQRRVEPTECIDCQSTSCPTAATRHPTRPADMHPDHFRLDPDNRIEGAEEYPWQEPWGQCCKCAGIKECCV